MSIAADDMFSSSGPDTPEFLVLSSPLGFDHITILGRYQFVVHESIQRGEFRPLRHPIVREDARDHNA